MPGSPRSGLRTTSSIVQGWTKMNESTLFPEEIEDEISADLAHVNDVRRRLMQAHRKTMLKGTLSDTSAYVIASSISQKDPGIYSMIDHHNFMVYVDRKVKVRRQLQNFIIIQYRRHFDHGLYPYLVKHKPGRKPSK